MGFRRLFGPFRWSLNLTLGLLVLLPAHARASPLHLGEKMTFSACVPRVCDICPCLPTMQCIYNSIPIPSCPPLSPPYPYNQHCCVMLLSIASQQPTGRPNQRTSDKSNSAHNLAWLSFSDERRERRRKEPRRQAPIRPTTAAGRQDT